MTWNGLRTASVNPFNYPPSSLNYPWMRKPNQKPQPKNKRFLFSQERPPDMRISRDTLLKAAKTFVQQRTYRDRDIVCVYLSGSLIDDLPLLGGTADIDLFLIHDKPPAQPREVIQLTPDIHLDLAHLDQSIYNQPRELRLNPWVGSYLIKDPIVLHATQHWFEFTQATVFSHFNQPENVIGRAIPFAEAARQTWLDFQLDPREPDINNIRNYLQALEQSSNAVSILNGAPITERRFLL